MTWTPDRIETLKYLWQKGLSASNIAETLGGVSRNAVLGKIHRLELPKRKQKACMVKKKRAPKVSTYQKPLKPKQRIEEPVIDGTEKTILDIRDGECRCCVSGEGADMLMCAKPVAIGSPWCEYHQDKLTNTKMINERVKKERQAFREYLNKSRLERESHGV